MEDISKLVGNNTIGLLNSRNELRGHLMFDVHRLRQAMSANELEFDRECIDVALVQHP